MKKQTKTNDNIKDLKLEISFLYQIIDTISESNNLEELLQQIAKLLAKNLKCDSCLVYLINSSSSNLILTSAWPPHPYHVGKLSLELGEGITGWVAEHKKPISISKNAFKDSRFKVFTNLPEDKYMAFMSVPIMLGSNTIGVINLQNKKTRNYTMDQTKLIVNIAKHIAGAIEKTRLLEISNRKTKHLETISKLSHSIVSNTYLKEILQLIVTMTAQMMNSKICSLMLFDEKTQELKIEATQSLSEEYRKKAPLNVGQSVSGQALELRKPVAVLDVTKEAGYAYPEIAKREGLKSMLAVPMFIKEKPIGVLNCYTTHEYVFTEEEINVIQTIASQSAITIENTRLLEESKTAKEALETRKIIERAKGMLMKERNLSEQDAFQFIQRQAMNLRRSMREISEAILLSEGLKNSNRN
ncbi:MAG: GAF domain-containing protein [Endomicrobiales bacterium]|nr:GAF domain-containing protein [Endomicrobiales bacterium]